MFWCCVKYRLLNTTLLFPWQLWCFALCHIVKHNSLIKWVCTSCLSHIKHYDRTEERTSAVLKYFVKWRGKNVSKIVLSLPTGQTPKLEWDVEPDKTVTTDVDSLMMISTRPIFRWFYTFLILAHTSVLFL